MTKTEADLSVSTARANRRRFKAESKEQTIAEYETAIVHGAPSDLLRRGSAHYSPIQNWLNGHQSRRMNLRISMTASWGLRVLQLEAESETFLAELANAKLVECLGKRAQVLPDDLQEQGHKDAADTVMLPVFSESRRTVSTSQACAERSVAQSNVFRWASTPLWPVRARRVAVIPWAFSAAAWARTLGSLDDDRTVDKAPAQVWTILLDEGVYACSQSTMYRILRSDLQVRERLAIAAHPPRTIPILLAASPDEVCSLDVAKPAGPEREVSYDACLIIDIYSRKIIHWQIRPGENESLAGEFLDAEICTNDGVITGFVHSNSGTPMTSQIAGAFLAGLEITRLSSRLHVSNDNPHSESLFKTLKYFPMFFQRFGSIQDSHLFMGDFVDYCNNDRQHSGLGLYTPPPLYDETADLHGGKPLDDLIARGRLLQHGRYPRSPDQSTQSPAGATRRDIEAKSRTRRQQARDSRSILQRPYPPPLPRSNAGRCVKSRRRLLDGRYQ